MFFELTDLLACPRCPPTHGLVLLVQEVEERRVLSGRLGCPRCRTDFPVSEGVADLRLHPRAERSGAEPLRDEDLAMKIAALSGLTEGREYLMIGERLAHAAGAVAEMLPGIEVIALASAPADWKDPHGVSRVLSDVAFPLAEFGLSAAVIAPGGNRGLVKAAARRVRAEGRLVLLDATDADIEEAESCGLTITARQGTTAVAERKGASSPARP